MADVYARVRERDGVCRGCAWAMGLEVHHIKFRSRGGPDEDWNLILLCKSCHARAHGLGHPFFPAWLLFYCVEREYDGTVIGLLVRGTGKCFSCEFQEKDKMCGLHDWQPAPDEFSCDSWVLRM